MKNRHGRVIRGKIIQENAGQLNAEDIYMDNYSDDVRQYDNDQRSPFYDDRKERYKEILLDMISDDPEIMSLALDADPTRFGNIVSILCDLYKEKTNGHDYKEQLDQFIFAWGELAESVANKRAEEIRNEQNRNAP